MEGRWLRPGSLEAGSFGKELGLAESTQSTDISSSYHPLV